MKVGRVKLCKETFGRRIKFFFEIGKGKRYPRLPGPLSMSVPIPLCNTVSGDTDGLARGGPRLVNVRQYKRAAHTFGCRPSILKVEGYGE